MKKLGIFILLLTSLFLVACNNAYVPKIRIAWRGDDPEVLTYNVTFVDDYSYAPSFDSIDYPATPLEISSGTYTTTLTKTASTPMIEYTVETLFTYRLYFAAEGFPAGFGTQEGDNVYFDNEVTTTTVFSGTIAAPFQKMIGSEQKVKITDVTKRGGVYNEPKAFDYTLTVDYGTNGKNYDYEFTSADPDFDIYGIEKSGSFSTSGIDNSILFYFIRALEMTPSNASQISSSVVTPDPFTGENITLSFAYKARKQIPVPSGVVEFGLKLPDTFDPANEVPYYDCAEILLAVSGDRNGGGIRLFYALNDTPSMSIAGYPERREQKLVRMIQGFWQYDLASN